LKQVNIATGFLVLGFEISTSSNVGSGFISKLNGELSALPRDIAGFLGDALWRRKGERKRGERKRRVREE